MAPPDPKNSGFVQPKNDDDYLNMPYNQPEMDRNSSKSSLLKRDGSMNKLVEEKHLGPQNMIKKVNQQVAYNQFNQGPLPHRPPSNMKSNSNMRKQESMGNGDYSD